MSTTRGQPEAEVPVREQALDAVQQAIAGRGVVRRVVLYVLAFALCVTPLPVLAVVPLALLMATDSAL